MGQYGKLVRDRSREWGRSTGRERPQDTEGRILPKYTVWFRGTARGQRPPDIFEAHGQKSNQQMMSFLETEGLQFCHWVPDSLMGTLSSHLIHSHGHTSHAYTNAQCSHLQLDSLLPHLSAHLSHLPVSHPNRQQCSAPLINWSHTLGCSQERKALTLRALSHPELHMADTRPLPIPALPAFHHGLIYTCLPSTCTDTTGTGTVETKPCL